MLNNFALNHIQPTPLLLAVMGSSPQVLTETLYGIYQSGQTIPKIIKVITTLHGKQKMIDHNMFGETGRVNQFTGEYDLPEICFELSDVWVIEDNQGAPLDDARSLSQHTALADFITEKVRQLTQATTLGNLMTTEDLPLQVKALQKKQIEDILNKQFANQIGFREITSSSKKKQLQFHPEFDQYSIHASIAGGRKSMTFLLGYAMSLFARSHDKVSHVLVDEAIENCPDFFYPSKLPNVQQVGWNNPQPIDFSQMRVELAEIPLVRVSQNMPTVLLKQSRSYSDTIALFEELNQEPKLTINLCPIAGKGGSNRQYQIICGQQKVLLDTKNLSYLLVYVKLKAPLDLYAEQPNTELALAMLNTYATLITQGQIQKPFTSRLQALSYFKDSENAHFSEEVVVGKGKKLVELLAEFTELLKKYQEDEAVKKCSMGGAAAGLGHSKYLSTLKEKLTKQMGEPLAMRYIPTNIESEKGDSENTKGRYKYALAIKPENITIIDQAH